ncbi:MAG: recombinase family protein [Clostridia bacterium]|nr:recombinase family protein [Clostridia bacterium]
MQHLTAVAYARYSSDKQQESSITVQLAAIHKFCDAHKIELIHEYIDEAQTGMNANRRDFQEMVRAAPDKEFKLIVVHRMDRWARNVDDARYYKKYFAKHGSKIVSAIEEFDDTPEGEFFELMSMGMAELYSKKLSREAVAGKLANAREGKIHGGTPPLGYRVQGKYYVIEEKEAEAVRIIFNMVVEGYGYTSIKSFLNSNGYRHADGRLFTAHFTDILRNRKYIGEYVYNRSAYRARGVEYNNHTQKAEEEIIRIPGGMPRIIDDDTFNKVQYILDERRKHPNLRGVRKKKYLLTGLLLCDECGKSFCGGKMRSHKIEYAIYKCNNRGMNCPSKSINALHLEEYLFKLLEDCLLSPKNIEKLCDTVKACYIKSYDSLNAEYDRIREEIESTEHTIKEQRDTYANSDNKILKSFVESGLRELERELNGLRYQLRDCEEKINLFPPFNPALIRRNAKSILAALKSEDIKTVQRTLHSILKCIKISNEDIETVINMQALMGAYMPLNIVIVEKRDYIARHENHSKRSLTFPTLTVKMEQTT